LPISYLKYVLRGMIAKKQCFLSIKIVKANSSSVELFCVVMNRHVALMSSKKVLLLGAVLVYCSRFFHPL
jgi:hypothetical protein